MIFQSGMCKRNQHTAILRAPIFREPWASCEAENVDVLRSHLRHVVAGASAGDVNDFFSGSLRVRVPHIAVP